MRAALYARFSSDLQDVRSIRDQLALCRERVARDGGEVVAIYEDAAISGASFLNRPGILRLIADAQAGRFDVVVAEALDRLSRGQSDTPRLLERLTFLGIKIITLAEGEITELHAGLMGTMNALQLKQIAAKTKRGQIGRLREGKIPGGRCYGYTVTGKGERRIDEAEAAIVRGIFADYAAGRTPHEIAAGLNHAHVPAPRGGQWNASTINGSRARANGILNNALYIGRIVYNRQSFRKDPDTGKRVARKNAQGDWMTIEVPALRIVDDRLWEAARTRKAAHVGQRPEHQMRAPRLLSGLLRCGCCGGSYTIIRANIVGCSAHREKGTCANGRLASIDLIETRVLDAIRAHLLAPEVIAAAVKDYHEERKRLAKMRSRERGELEREAGETARKIGRLVSAIENSIGDEVALVARLRELEARRADIAARLEDIADPVIAIHPGAAERLSAMIADLGAALRLTDTEARREAFAAVRDLVVGITIVPKAKGEPVGLEIEGLLAAMLARDGQPGLPSGSSSAERDSPMGQQSRGALVAGTRNSSPPLTIRFAA